MNRREFLFFRTQDRQRIVELSCECLYMQYLDVQLTWGPRQEPTPFDDQVWGGEPTAVFEARSAEQLFGEIEQDLDRADVLRISNPEWLTTEPLGRHVQALIDSFSARGGKVELIPSTPSSTGHAPRGLQRPEKEARPTRLQGDGPSDTR